MDFFLIWGFYMSFLGQFHNNFFYIYTDNFVEVLGVSEPVLFSLDSNPKKVLAV